ncbi:hypothetical protein KQX54_021000 [Cotesia glomerata]|uniref:Uncharacterized protein n=1 Tax=Cotesia glomerata TaxID=32391 RepID=A0AAV7J893_COTGL|nr:hypothetical protein KQX54_021000 [Cotesia glomerata]
MSISKELESSNHQISLRVVHQLFLAAASTLYQLASKETERGYYGTLWHSLAIADGKLTSSVYQLSLILILERIVNAVGMGSVKHICTLILCKTHPAIIIQARDQVEKGELVWLVDKEEFFETLFPASENWQLRTENSRRKSERAEQEASKCGNRAPMRCNVGSVLIPTLSTPLNVDCPTEMPHETFYLLRTSVENGVVTTTLA